MEWEEAFRKRVNSLPLVTSITEQPLQLSLKSKNLGTHSANLQLELQYFWGREYS
jgi:hypothetical protein